MITVKSFLNEVSKRTWAVSLDPWPNRTWGCAHICFSILRMGVASISSHRYGGITRGNDVIDIVRFTDIIYICQLANKIKGKINHVYLETECQKSYRSYVHRYASAEKLILLDLFAKNTECTRENNSPRRLPTFRSEC